MSKSIQQIEARKLRARGYSIKDIATELGVSKSSASIWCRNVELNSGQIQRLHQKMVKGGYVGRLKGALANKEKKKQQVEYYLLQGKKDIQKLNKQELLIAGLALYWGEGGKTENRVRFYNSDPTAILFIVRWLTEAFALSKDRIYFYVLINEVHADRIDQVTAYWSRVTRSSFTQFRKPILIKAKNKKIYENHHEHFGTLCVAVTKSSSLFYRIMGLIKALSMAG